MGPPLAPPRNPAPPYFCCGGCSPAARSPRRVALVSGKEAASDSFPTNSTSSLAPAAATKATAASRTVLHIEHDSPKDDLSPGARSIYGFLVDCSSKPTSTASLHAPSSAISTTTPATASASSSTHISRPATKDGLSPEARLIYDYIVGNSDEFASRDGLSPAARHHYDYLVGGSTPPASPTTVVSTNLDNTDLTTPTPTICSSECPSKDAPAFVPVITPSTTMTAPPSAPSSAASIGGIPEPGAATAASERNLHSLTPSNCSTICSGSSASATTTPLYQAAVPAPLASPKHHLMVDVDITTTELTWVTTDICSMGCLDGAANSVEINNTNTMSPTFGNFNFTHVLLGESDSLCSDTVIVPVPRVTASADVNDDMSQDCQNLLRTEVVQFAGSNGVAPTLKQVRAQPPGGILDVFSILMRSLSSLIFVEVCPSSAEKVQHSLMLEELKPGLSLEMHLLVLVVMRKEAVFWPVFQSARCNTALLLPWDPGVLMNGMCAIFHGFVLKSTQLVLWATKSPWPPPPFNSNTACRILNLHCTLDNMQLSGDCRMLKALDHKLGAVFIVVIFVPGVQKAQLKQSMFKWSDLLCSGIHCLNASTLDFLPVRRAAHIVWNWCCVDNFHGFLGSTNWALEEEKGKVLLSVPWLSFRCHWIAACPILLGKIPTGHAACFTRCVMLLVLEGVRVAARQMLLVSQGVRVAVRRHHTVYRIYYCWRCWYLRRSPWVVYLITTCNLFVNHVCLSCNHV